MARTIDKILLVDDEETVRRFSSRVLEKHGFDVLVASSGPAALAAAAESECAIDLLLTDVMMPDMNGCELAERLLAQHPSLRVLFMSGFAENVLVSHAVLVPGNAFLGKPFRPTALVTKVREVLDTPAGARSRRGDDVS